MSYYHKLFLHVVLESTWYCCKGRGIVVKDVALLWLRSITNTDYNYQREIQWNCGGKNVVPTLNLNPPWTCYLLYFHLYRTSDYGLNSSRFCKYFTSDYLSTTQECVGYNRLRVCLFSSPPSFKWDDLCPSFSHSLHPYDIL